MTDYTKPESKSAIAEKALKCFKRASEAWQKQRDREKDDLRFQVPEMQWDEGAKRQRQGMTVDGVPTPARPILNISKIDQPIQLVEGQQRSAHLGIEIHPITEDAEMETAEVMQDHYRQIERDSNAHMARSWAFARALRAGMGCYRVNTEYDEQSDHPSDQKITIKRILDQASVMFDPDAQEVDFSDAEWAFVTLNIRASRFKSKYPKAKDPLGDALTFSDAVTGSDGWITGEDDDPLYRISEYWWKEHRYEDVTWEDEDGSEQKRQKELVTVMWATLAPGGDEETLQFLEGPQEWNGTYIPLVPVIGHEVIPFDDDRRWVGMIGPAKDAQRGFNYSTSTAVEIAALEPKAPYIGVEGQFEGHESEWQQANIRNFPYLEYKGVSVGAAPAPAPQRSQVDSGHLNVSMQLAEMFDRAIQATTFVYDPSLGRDNGKERSGKAIVASQEQSNAATSIYLLNMADISMQCEARIVVDLDAKIYDRPGRIVRTRGVEGKSSVVMLNAPHYKDPNTGRPVRLKIGPDGKPTGAPQGSAVIHHDYSKGRYAPSVTVGKAYQTRLAQGSAEISQFMQALPPPLQVAILPTWLKFQDWPGHGELSQIMEKIRDKEMPFLAGDEKNPDPKQLAAQAQAMQQQVQVLTQQLQAAGKMIETEQVKHQAAITMAQIKAETDRAKTQTDENIARQNNATKLAIARITAAKESMDAIREDQEESIALSLNLAHEAQEASEDRAHEVGMAGLTAQHAQEQAQMAAQQDQQMQQGDQAHDLGMAASGQAHEADMAASGQAHEQQMAQQAEPQADGAGV